MVRDIAPDPREFPCMSFTYATLCSGVDVPSLAWARHKPRPVFFSEIAKEPSRVLAHHWPKVPNLGDMLTIDGYDHREQVDVLWASFPCQAWSEAGERRGLKDDRGLLTLAGVRLVDEIAPPIFCFENVRGLLTDKENGFGQFLGALVGEPDALQPTGGRWTNSGYVRGPRRSIAWRKLDAKYFGLAQQRERIFLVATDRASGVDPRDILFERRTVQDAARECNPYATRSDPRDDGGPYTYSVAIRGRTHGGVERQQIEQGGLIAHCLRASQGGSDKPTILTQDAKGDWRLRLLTPVEAERCMGIPDNHTLVPNGKKPMSDSARYKMIGNSLPLPVVAWIGDRIVEALTKARASA